MSHALYLGFTTASGIATHTLVPPEGIRNGDIAIVATSTRNTNLNGPTAGSLLQQVYNYDTGSNEEVGLWWRICRAGEPDFVISCSGADSASLAVFYRPPAPVGKPMAAYTDNSLTGPPLEVPKGGLAFGLFQGCYLQTALWNKQWARDAYVEYGADEWTSIGRWPVRGQCSTGYSYEGTGAGGGSYNVSATLVFPPALSPPDIFNR